MLSVLLTSCVKSVPVSTPTEPCRVPKLPALVVTEKVCGGDVCYSPEDAVKLAEWFYAVEKYRAAVRRCPLVTND